LLDHDCDNALQLLNPVVKDLNLILLVHISHLSVVHQLQDLGERHFAPNELDDLNWVVVSSLVQQLQLLFQVLDYH